MRFQVKAGFHKSGKEVYGKNDVIDSDVNLLKVFPGKFRRVAEDDDGDEEENDENPRPRRKTKSSKLKSKSRSKKDKPIKKLTLRERLKQKELIGKDVTTKFEGAMQKSLRVYKTKDGKYNVANEKEAYNTLHPDPLTRMGLAKFLSDYSSDADHDGEE